MPQYMSMLKAKNIRLGYQSLGKNTHFILLENKNILISFSQQLSMSFKILICHSGFKQISLSVAWQGLHTLPRLKVENVVD
jgi:hypothetical protein